MEPKEKELFTDHQKHNHQSAINWLRDGISKMAQSLNSEDEKELRAAFLLVTFYLGTQEQYHEIKNQ